MDSSIEPYVLAFAPISNERIDTQLQIRRTHLVLIDEVLGPIGIYFTPEEYDKRVYPPSLS